MSFRALARVSFLLASLASGGASSAQDWIDAPRLVLSAETEEFRGVADLDGDGDADLLVAEDGPDNRLQSVHALLQVPGGFVAGAPTLIQHGSGVYVGTYLLRLGDITQDGLPDLVIDVRNASTSDDGLRIYPNVGGSFGAPLFVPVGKVLFKDAGFADGDGDGHLELAVTLVTTSGPSAVGWWRWNGTTLVPRPHAAVMRYPGSLALADFTGDGRIELLVGQDSGPEARLFVSLPGGQPSQIATFAFGSSALGTTRRFNTGDMDGDGDLDLVVSWQTYPSFGRELRVILARNESGILVPGDEQVFTIDPSSSSVMRGFLVDWDQDGDLDLLIHSTSLEVLENRGGTFALVDELYTVPGSRSYGASGAGVADLTGDGRPDFAAGRFVYAGDGELDQAGPLPPGLHSIDEAEDFDDDHDLDLIDFYSTNWMNVLENDATGRFTTHPLTLPPVAGHFYDGDSAPLDLDGDGLRDLLRVLHVDDYPLFPVVETRLLRGTPIGTFEARAASAPGVGIDWSGVAADVDGDGDPDLLVSAGYWENDGQGAFLSLHSVWSAQPMDAQDVDGDGDLDVLLKVRSRSAVTLTLARNQGGSFALEPIVSQSNDVRFGTTPLLDDLDGDGDPELAIGTALGGPAVLLYENQDGSFLAPLRLSQDDEAIDRIVFEDYDGDGQKDVLAMPTLFENGVWFLWRQAPAAWQFTQPEAYIGGQALLSGDFDADGDIDVVARRVVRSRRFEGPEDGRVRQRGAGGASLEPIAPRLGARGPLRPGSSTASLRVNRATGGAVGRLFVATEALEAPGAFSGETRRLAPVLTFALGGTPGAGGEGSAELALGPATVALQGLQLRFQALITAPSHPHRLAYTNSLELTFGR